MKLKISVDRLLIQVESILYFIKNFSTIKGEMEGYVNVGKRKLQS